MLLCKVAPFVCLDLLHCKCIVIINDLTFLRTNAEQVNHFSVYTTLEFITARFG